MLPICALDECLYILYGVLNTQRFGVLCRTLENLERKVVDKSYGRGCIITTSAWVYFLEKSFWVLRV